MTVRAVLRGIVGVAVLKFISVIFNGYVLNLLWGWFVVPVFGLPHLSIVPAIGIAIVISYLTHQLPNIKEEKMELREKIARNTAIAIREPLLALFFGWIVHFFI